jgi:hypothetical protein
MVCSGEWQWDCAEGDPLDLSLFSAPRAGGAAGPDQSLDLSGYRSG